MKRVNYVFLGPPGAGKGTQALRVSQRLGIPHISTGELFREAIRLATPLGARVERMMSTGELVPDEITNEVVRERLLQPDAREGWILDGYPRSVAQAEFLLEIGYEANVINLTVPDQALIARLSGRRVCAACRNIEHVEFLSGDSCTRCGGALTQREDDAPESVARRLAIYHEVTAPLEDWYRQRGVLINIDGNAGMDRVTDAILAAMETLH